VGRWFVGGKLWRFDAAFHSDQGLWWFNSWCCFCLVDIYFFFGQS